MPVYSAKVLKENLIKEDNQRVVSPLDVLNAVREQHRSVRDERALLQRVQGRLTDGEKKLKTFLNVGVGLVTLLLAPASFTALAAIMAATVTFVATDMIVGGIMKWNARERKADSIHELRALRIEEIKDEYREKIEEARTALAVAQEDLRRAQRDQDEFLKEGDYYNADGSVNEEKIKEDGKWAEYKKLEDEIDDLIEKIGTEKEPGQLRKDVNELVSERDGKIQEERNRDYKSRKSKKGLSEEIISLRSEERHAQKVLNRTGGFGLLVPVKAAASSIQEAFAYAKAKPFEAIGMAIMLGLPGGYLATKLGTISAAKVGVAGTGLAGAGVMGALAAYALPVAIAVGVAVLALGAIHYGKKGFALAKRMHTLLQEDQQRAQQNQQNNEHRQKRNKRMDAVLA